jgi:hemerythrin-like domain-containing protein
VSKMERKPTEILEEEHRVIQKVVGVIAVLAEEVESGRDVKPETFQEVVEFMRTFADKCHHGKEETHLFPMLVKKGVPVRGCPMGILITEHQRGRALVSELATASEKYAAGDTSSRKALLQTLQNLRTLYPDHIWKEDYLLFPMTDKILSPEEQKDLHEKFEMVEKDMGEDVHHRFEQLAEKLEKRIQGS